MFIMLLHGSLAFNREGYVGANANWFSGYFYKVVVTEFKSQGA